MSKVEWDGTGMSPWLYSRTATGAINLWQCWADGGSVHVTWGQQGGTMQHADFKCKPKNEGRANATTAEQQAVKEAKAKWVKQIKKKYSPQLETAGETKRIKPILALEYKKLKSPIPFPAVMQPKLDGVRCLAYRLDGHVVLQSRGGDYWDVEHIRGELEHLIPEDIILDGELYMHGVSLQTITSIVRRPQAESAGLYYCVFDITNKKHSLGSWECRWIALQNFFAERTVLARTQIIQVPDVIINDQKELEHYQSYYENQGYEGAIIRTWDGQYREDYRGKDLIKKKNWEDAEFVIVDWTVGKGKHENAPVFRCAINPADPGRNFEVVPIGTASERYQMLQNAGSYVGQLLKVKFLGWTDAGKPKCARGISIRYPSDM